MDFLSDQKYTNTAVRKVISEPTLRAIREQFGYERLSKVQAATLEPFSAGDDFFVKSKTGSGKTMAFLVPLVERAAAAVASAGDVASSSPWTVYSVIVSPTKELATQTHTEAMKLLKFHPGLEAALIIGGVDKKRDVAQIPTAAQKNRKLAVVVATPGRLHDHIQSTPGFVGHMASVHSVVLDEADRMLDGGFKRSLEAILDACTRPKRQVVLVSATMPDVVLKLAHAYLRPGWTRIDVTDGANDEEEQVGARVNPNVDHYALVPTDTHLTTHLLLHLICNHASRVPDFKIIVFFPSRKQVQFMTALLRNANLPCLSNVSNGSNGSVLEIRSDLSQSERNRAADTFRKGSRMVLVGTDVIERGVDFPGVTCVIQMGVTNRESYVHRTGRTGRAGHKGEAFIVLSPFEEAGMRRVLEGLNAGWYSGVDTPRMTEVERGVKKMMAENKEKTLKSMREAYLAWLGTYASKVSDLRVTKPQVEAEAKRVFTGLGFQEAQLPEITPKLRQKMGFR